MEITIWFAGVRQVPFNFSVCEPTGKIEVPKETVSSWVAGQEVHIDGRQFIVSKTLLPAPETNLWEIK